MMINIDMDRKTKNITELSMVLQGKTSSSSSSNSLDLAEASKALEQAQKELTKMRWERKTWIDIDMQTNTLISPKQDFIA